MIENSRIHIKPLQVLTRRQFTDAMRNRMMLPGILQSPQKERKTPASVREANPQIGWQLVEGSAQDHRNYADLRLGGHADRPGHHVLRHAFPAQHVPWMHQNRCALVGAVMQKSDDAGIIEILISDMIPNLYAKMPSPHASAQLVARSVNIL